MNSLLDSTARLLETASNCSQSGLETSDWTLFIGPDGGLQMVAGCTHDLAALAWTRGATSAWQVVSRGSSVRVEGWENGSRCILESPRPAFSPSRLLGDLRLYELAV